MKSPRPAEPWDPAHPPRTSDAPTDPAGDVAEHSPSSKPIPIAGLRPHV